ncbi:MAG: replicative DNA helicase [Clostridiales bacterium]|nr:replicative DNA helicase [Clostridiales bacterium]
MPDQFKLPPYNLDAEKALLGACLLNKEAVNEIMAFVRAEDFYGDNHRLIFSAMHGLVMSGSPCDLVTLTDALSVLGHLERAGGIIYIASLTDTVPAASAAIHYAKIVAEKALLRTLIAAASHIEAEGYSGTHTAEELLELAEKTIFEVAQRRAHEGFFALRDILIEVYDMMGRIKAAEGVTGLPTFRDLDKLLSGLQKSDLIILAARPGIGKTTMAVNIAQRAAVKHGKRVAIFSLEMPKEQLVQRMLCTQAEVNLSVVRKGTASREDFERLAKALLPLNNAEIYIDDSAVITVSEMRSKCRKLMLEKQGLDLVVVDYIQLMQSAGGRRGENRQQEVAEFSRSLKALAKELDVPVLALSQLSRQAEKGSEAPNLSHLRESGALEQDADVVIMLHQQRVKENEDGAPMSAALAEGGQSYPLADILQVIVAKHRNGPVGEVKLLMRRAFTSFEDIAFDWQEQ